jgi:hypothetical protein
VRARSRVLGSLLVRRRAFACGGFGALLGGKAVLRALERFAFRLSAFLRPRFLFEVRSFARGGRFERARFDVGACRRRLFSLALRFCVFRGLRGGALFRGGALLRGRRRLRLGLETLTRTVQRFDFRLLAAFDLRFLFALGGLARPGGFDGPRIGQCVRFRGFFGVPFGGDTRLSLCQCLRLRIGSRVRRGFRLRRGFLARLGLFLRARFRPPARAP